MVIVNNSVYVRGCRLVCVRMCVWSCVRVRVCSYVCVYMCVSTCARAYERAKHSNWVPVWLTYRKAKQTSNTVHACGASKLVGESEGASAARD